LEVFVEFGIKFALYLSFTSGFKKILRRINRRLTWAKKESFLKGVGVSILFAFWF
jgi:hypothetical protein